MEDYVQRINRTMDYIEAHLGDPLDLETIARVAAFSPYHFHRIFSSIAREPLYQFILRHRLSRAILQMFDTQLSLTEIALDCGFSSSSAFSRAFREKYQQSPSEYRKKRLQAFFPEKSQDSKNRQNPRKDREVSGGPRGYVEYRAGGQTWIGPDQTVRQVDIVPQKAMRFAYVRHVGPYKGDAGLFQRLWDQYCHWAGPRGILEDSQTRYLSLYHNDPSTTEEPKLRLSLGSSVPPGTEGAGNISLMDIGEGLYARSEWLLGPADYQGAWAWLYGQWLPVSGYVPEDGLAYEEYFFDQAQNDQGKTRVVLGVPVKPME
jgi:AraC family transcriptional regulator